MKTQKIVIRMVEDETGETEDVVEVSDRNVCDGCRRGTNVWKCCDMVGIEALQAYVIPRLPDLKEVPKEIDPTIFVKVSFPADEWETIKKEMQAEVGAPANWMTNAAFFKVVVRRNVKMKGDLALDFEILSDEAEALRQAKAAQTLGDALRATLN